MNCREWSAEIVECVRRDAEPDTALRTHLHLCAECQARWEAERTLVTPMRVLRAAVSAERSSQFQRASLMTEFARIHRAAPRRHIWAFSAAAAVLLALALGLSSRSHAPAATAVEIAEDDGFVAVPYAAPLAPGEFVRVVRTELYAAALDRMGVSVPATNGQFPAEVVLGQDGLPRAVRVLEDVNF